MKTANDYVVDSPIRSLSALANAEAGCMRCPLYKHATQARAEPARG